ncbi:hypothetical protein GN956_G25598 [Arapaima gigas]
MERWICERSLGRIATEHEEHEYADGLASVAGGRVRNSSLKSLRQFGSDRPQTGRNLQESGNLCRTYEKLPYGFSPGNAHLLKMIDC